MESFPPSSECADVQMYGGTVLALFAEAFDDTIPSMPGPPATKGTSISTSPKTGPDKNGQYKTDSDSDSNVDLD